VRGCWEGDGVGGITKQSSNLVALPRRDSLTFERMPGESAVAFAAFVVYRDVGPTRSIRKLRQEVGKSRAVLERWSVRWSWVERVRLWDAEVDANLRAENLERLQEDARRHHAVAGLFLQKLVERLQAVRPEDLPLSALPHYLDVAVKVQRLALGVAADTVEVAGNPERPLEVAVRFVRDWDLAEDA
jgi:hypothetical protein